MACFKTNRARMDCPRFRERNLCVSTGVVEGARRSMIGSRLKQGCIHWSVDGATVIIARRYFVHSNRFDDFRERGQAEIGNPAQICRAMSLAICSSIFDSKFIHATLAGLLVENGVDCGVRCGMSI